MDFSATYHKRSLSFLLAVGFLASKKERTEQQKDNTENIKPSPSGWLRDQTDEISIDEQAYSNIMYNQTVHYYFCSSQQITEEQ